MSALQHIRDYLAAKFAGHDIETLMTHFETAIEAKVEAGLADLKQELAELRNDLTGTRPVTPPAEPESDPVMPAIDALLQGLPEATTENAK